MQSYPNFKQTLALKKGNKIETLNEEIINFRLITNIKEFTMKETLIKREFNFYELLSNAVRGDNFKDILEEYDIVFYIHGGGFLAQSVESSVGFLSE